MDGVIELQRRTHEDMDRLEVAAAEILAQGNQGLTQKERISRELTVSALLNQISSSAQQLLHLYKDDDKTRAQGINEISIEDGTNIFGSFYVHLKELKDDYRRSPFDRPIDDVEFDALVLSCRPSDESKFLQFFTNKYKSIKFELVILSF